MSAMMQLFSSVGQYLRPKTAKNATRTLLIDASGILSSFSYYDSTPNANLDLYFQSVLGAIRCTEPTYIYACYSARNIDSLFRTQRYQPYLNSKRNKKDWFARWNHSMLLSINEIHPQLKIQSIVAQSNFEALDLICSIMHQLETSNNNTFGSDTSAQTLNEIDQEPNVFVLSFSTLSEQLLHNKLDNGVGLICKNCAYHPLLQSIRSNSNYYQILQSTQTTHTTQANQTAPNSNQTESDSQTDSSETSDDSETETQNNSNNFGNSIGVSNDQIVDYWALVGRPHMNVPGVYGVGPKRAKHILNTCGSVKNLLDEAQIEVYKSQLSPGMRKLIYGKDETVEKLKVFYQEIMPFRNDVDLKDSEYNRENVKLFDETHQVDENFYRQDSYLNRLSAMKNSLEKYEMTRCIATIDFWRESQDDANIPIAKPLES